MPQPPKTAKGEKLTQNPPELDRLIRQQKADDSSVQLPERFGSDERRARTASVDRILDSGRDPALPEGTAIRVVADEGASRARQIGVMPPRGKFRRSMFQPLHPASTNTALAAALRPFLDVLTERQHTAIRLCFFEGMTERDAAELMAVSQPVVHEHLQRAFAKIRDALVEASDQEAYADIRRWLTPSQTIRDDGTEDRWRRTHCIYGREFLGMFLPSSLGDEPLAACYGHHWDRNASTRAPSGVSASGPVSLRWPR